MQMYAPVVSFLLIFSFFDLFIFAYCCSLAIVHGASISMAINIYKQTTNVCIQQNIFNHLSFTRQRERKGVEPVVLITI